LVGKPGRDHSGDLGVDGKIILDWILGKLGGKVWTGFMWFRIGPVAGSYEHGSEPSGSVKAGSLKESVPRQCVPYLLGFIKENPLLFSKSRGCR
jgi:hypothetical protein